MPYCVLSNNFLDDTTSHLAPQTSATHVSSFLTFVAFFNLRFYLTNYSKQVCKQTHFQYCIGFLCRNLENHFTNTLRHRLFLDFLFKISLYNNRFIYKNFHIYIVSFSSLHPVLLPLSPQSTPVHILTCIFSPPLVYLLLSYNTHSNTFFSIP